MRCVAVFVGINHASAVSFSGCAVQRSLCYTLKVSLLLMSIYHIMRQLNHLLPSILFQSTLLSLLSAIFKMVLGSPFSSFQETVTTRNRVDIFVLSFLRQYLLDPQSSFCEFPLHFYLTSFHREDLVPVAQ